MNHLTANTPLALFIVTKPIGNDTEAIISLNMLLNIASTNFWAQVKTVSPLDLGLATAVASLHLGLATAAASLHLGLATAAASLHLLCFFCCCVSSTWPLF